MLDKFGRNFQLLFEFNTGAPAIVIQKPFTIEFDIVRTLLGAPSYSTLRIMNLNENNRSQIRKDWDDSSDDKISLTLKAGYGDVIPIVLIGDVWNAYSVREGNTFVTQVLSYDGGFAFQNSKFNTSFPSGTPQRTIIMNLAESLKPYGVSIGSIGNYDGAIVRGNSYSGSAPDILRELTGGGFFIDNGKVNCLNEGEFIFGDELIINAQTGLLGTPRREFKLISFDILFEPRVFIGQQLTIQSSTGDFDINGTYRVNEIRHKGMISEAVCGNAITTITCLTGAGIPVAQEEQ